MSICEDFRYTKNRGFRADFLSELSKGMTNILPCRFRHSFGPFNMLTVHKCSDTRLFTDLSNPAFWSLYLEKVIPSKGNLFFQSIQNFMQIPEMQQESEKIFFDFEIIAFELFAIDTCFCWERILVIGCQYVKKQSQDFRYYQNRIFGEDFLS